MAAPWIAVTSTSFSKHAELRSEILQLDPNARFNDSGKSLSPVQVAKHLHGCEVAVVGLESVGEELLKSLPHLKLIAKYGVGLDNLDLDACRRRGVQIGWTAGVNARAVAEQTIGLMIGLSRNLFSNSRLLREGHWRKDGGQGLSDLKVGVIGVGFVGKEVIRALRFFGADVLCNDILDVSDFARSQGAKVRALKELLEESDIVTLHVPLTDLTRGMISAETLSILRPGAMLINTARGEVVQMHDLYLNLKSGHLGAAALDVFPDEPFSDPKFLELPNAVCTPHTSGNSSGAVWAMGRAAIGHIQSWQAVHGRVG